MIGSSLLWLVILEIFGIAAFPIAYRAFSKMPDRGWAFSKPLGLVFVGFGTWVIGLTHTLPNSRWTVLIALAIIVIASWAASRSNRDEMIEFLRRRLNTILTAELLFIAAFLGMTLFRATVTSIGATEQPMDLMLLNAVTTSRFYPPIDPWLAGETISYYYLGYLMLGTVTMLSGIATPIAYNLGLATAAAMGAIAAFGVAFNLVRLARGSEDGAVFAGITASFLLLVASNLVGTLELVRAAGIGNEAFWASVGVNGLTAPDGPSSSWAPDETHLWWWRASRAVPPAHINEFPLFSFLVGDLHPHVMSIGFVLLTVGTSIQLYLQQGLIRFHDRLGPLAITITLLASLVILLLVVLDVNLLWMLPLLAVAATALMGSMWPLGLTVFISTGALGAMNLWDLPLGLALIVGALLLSTARNERSVGFGTAIDISGPRLISGAPNDSTLALATGAAAVYTNSPSSGSSGPRAWAKEATLRPVADNPAARFGAAVGIDQNTAVVGSPGTETALVYVRNDDQWLHRSTLRVPDGQRAQNFGKTLTVYGDDAAIGADGSVYVFEQISAICGLAAKLATLDRRADFGHAVSLWGDILVVGAPGINAAYIYRRSTQGQAWKLEQQLTGPANFGRSVSAGEDRIAIGADDCAMVYRDLPTGWQMQQALTPAEEDNLIGFGASVAIQRWFLAVGAEGGGHARRTGNVTVFETDGEKWEPQDELTVQGLAGDSFFGGAIAISEDTVAIGAPGRGHGAGYLFNRALDQWSLSKKLTSQWRLGPSVLSAGLLITATFMAFMPFFVTFDSNASGVLPLLSLLTRPLHLALLWGVSGLLVLPVLVIALRSVFVTGSWNTKRFGIALFGGFTPIALWLQPIWAFPVLGVFILTFALHQAGYRMARADETTFAYNPKATLAVGGTTIIIGLLVDGIRNVERGIGGELLAIDRLLVTVPMAIVISLALYGAWTIAHRDSEILRTSADPVNAETTGDAIAPALGLLAVAAALVMGVELFHVVDIFGGDYRRINTMFKLHYQAWQLFAVLGGFAVWYVTTRWDRRVLSGRIGATVWVTLLIVALGAVSYYPLAAITSRSGGTSTLDLDGQSHVERNAPAEYAAIQWIRANTPRDAVVVEAAVIPCSNETLGCHSYTDAARISSSTGRPTIIGWIGHERQWRRSEMHGELDRRLSDVRLLYETTLIGQAAEILAHYDTDYVVVGPRERNAYGVQGAAKFAELGTLVFSDFTNGQDVTIYQINKAVGL
jgi:uncharacterized membrane protein